MIDSKKAAELSEKSRIKMRPIILTKALVSIEDAAAAGDNRVVFLSEELLLSGVGEYVLKSLHESGFKTDPENYSSQGMLGGITINW